MRVERLNRQSLEAAAPAMYEAILALFLHLPDLWGDHVVNGKIRLTLEESAVDSALAALTRAELP